MLVLCAALAAPSVAHAAGIVNGDFATGDFTGWSLDTDGFPGTSNDFSVVGSPGAYSGRIEADYWSTPGDIFSIPLNDVFFANTLFQELETSIAPGSQLELSFDWTFGGEDGDPAVGEIFLVGLNDGLGNLYDADGMLGFLIDPTTTYGGGSFSTLLDTAVFANSPGWFLDFQLQVGVDGFGDPNAFGSYVEIGNVILAEVSSQAAPVPPSAVLLGLGLPTLAAARRRRQP